MHPFLDALNAAAFGTGVVVWCNVLTALCAAAALRMKGKRLRIVLEEAGPSAPEAQRTADADSA